MSFTGFLTTEKGKQLLTKLLSGEKLLLTGVSAGSGLCQNEEMGQNLNHLITPKMEGTSTVPSFFDGVVGLTLEFRSDLLEGDGFFLSEYGIYALDPDEGEILLYYASLGENPSYLTGNQGKYASVLRFDVSIAIDDDYQAGVGLTYPASAFVRYEEMDSAFLAHNQDLEAHEGLFGGIVDQMEGLESSFSNSLEELESSLEKDFEKLETSLEEMGSSLEKDLKELESSLEKDFEKLETSLEEMGTKDHKHDTSDLTSGVLPLSRGGLGNTSGQAVTANSLTTARNLSVNLGSTTVSSFNGTGNAVLGVSGVLPVVNGGTGASSTEGLKTALGITSLVGVTNKSSSILGEDGETSLGVGANASGSCSVALGQSATSSGMDGVAVGMCALSVGKLSTSLGTISQANGDFSVALGANATADTINGIALGNSAVSGGVGSQDSVENTLAIGCSCSATGTSAVALGYNTRASNTSSMALGSSSTSTGTYCISVGNGSKSSGDYTLAIGVGSNATNSNTMALGRASEALGIGSTSLGAYANTTSSESSYIQLGGQGYTAVLRSPVTLTVSSDMRDKTDISPVSDSLEFLSKIQPMGYVMNYRCNYEEDFSEELQELEEKEKEISKTSENLSKTGDEDYSIEALTLEEKSRLASLKERKGKRNTYGRGDYDRESHKKGEKKGKRRRIGVLAQDVQQAMLEQYGTDNYADLVIDNLYEVDDVPDGMESTLGVNYSNFIPFLIDGVNRLYAENQEMKERILRLETLLNEKEDNI